MDSAAATDGLVLSVLGPLEVRTGAGRLSLPRSKKTRALLAYLVTTGRAHRRDRLCSLLWEGTDDPRGALRWSLSRLRRVFGAGEGPIAADREEVSVRTDGVTVDAHELWGAVGRGVDHLDVDGLERLAALPRGEFLEGLDLPELHEFDAWCIAERERFREAHCRVLETLVGRLQGDPERALSHARQWAQADAFSVAAQTGLLRTLLEAGKGEEARQRFESGRRLYREVDAGGLRELEMAWRSMHADRARVADAPVPSPPPSPSPSLHLPQAPSGPPSGPAAADLPVARPGVTPFVGRRDELGRLETILEAARCGGPPRIALLTGEPGAGKSRLAERLTSRATSGGFVVVRGRAYEAESSRPYGPWVDALGIALDELVAGAEPTRDALFFAVAARLAALGRDQAGLVLILDDLQWMDRDSAELLHFIARTHHDGPLLLLLLARGGELGDNEAVTRALRGLRREAGDRLVQWELEPLSMAEIGELVGGQPGAAIDLSSLYAACAGNPLYAIELVRAPSVGAGQAPSTLVQLVRERIELLPSHAVDVLRWGAVLGHAIDVERLEALSSLEPDEIVDALERLEHHALLRIDASRARERYVFSHDVVREAVYGELSHPRRRMMHRKVAHLLAPQATAAEIATQVAHHAGWGGEAELGVKACVAAGTQSLRVFANGDAEALARRGLRLASELDGPARIAATLDLLGVQFAARTPDREEAAARVRDLAEQALDQGLTREARLGFQMLSYLRWESASMADAHANIMQAERVSRAAGPEERTVALAQAAKCLVLLERNLGQAEAFVMEADALADRSGRSSSAVAFALGMIAAHRGEFDAAVESFREARALAREHGERLAEFVAVEHWVMVEIDRGRGDACLDLAEQVADLGGRVRPGAEAPSGRALLAFVRHLAGQSTADEVEVALDAVRDADAKYELAFLLTRWAEHECQAGEVDRARRLAEDALLVSRAIGRSSETALSHAVLVACTEGEEQAAHLERLRALQAGDLSRIAQERIAARARAGLDVLGSDAP